MSIDTKKELDNAINARFTKINELIEQAGVQSIVFETKGLLVRTWRGVETSAKLPMNYYDKLNDLIIPLMLAGEDDWTRPGKVLLLEKLGTDKIANDAFTAAKVFDGACSTSKIGYRAFTTEKIADDAIDDSAIANGAITTVKIPDGAITPEKFAQDAITQKNLDGKFNCNVVFFTKTLTLKNDNNAFSIKFVPNTTFTRENIILFARVKLTLSQLPEDSGIDTKPLIKNDNIELLASATELYAPCGDTHYYVWERFLEAHYSSQTGMVTVNFAINAKDNTIISFSVYIYPEFVSTDVFTERAESFKTERRVIQEQETIDGKEIQYQHYSSNLQEEPSQSFYQEKTDLPGGKTSYVVVNRSERPDKTVKNAKRYITTSDGQMVLYDSTQEQTSPLKKTTTHTRYDTLILVSKQVTIDILGNKLEQEINTNLRQRAHTVNITGTKIDQNQQEVTTTQANLNINQQGEVFGQINQLEVKGEINDNVLNIQTQDKRKQIISVYQKDEKGMLHTTEIKDEDRKSEIKTSERKEGSKDGDDFYSANKNENDLINMSKFIQQKVDTAKKVIENQIDKEKESIKNIIDSTVEIQKDSLRAETEALIIRTKNEQQQQIEEKIYRSNDKVKKQLTKKIENKIKSLEMQLEQEKVAQQKKNDEVKTVLTKIDKKLIASTENQNKINNDINKIQEHQENLQNNLAEIETQINDITTTIQTIATTNPQQTKDAIETALRTFKQKEQAELDLKLATAIEANNKDEEAKLRAQITALQKDIQTFASDLESHIRKYGVEWQMIKKSLSGELDNHIVEIRSLRELQKKLKHSMLIKITNQEKKTEALEKQIAVVEAKVKEDQKEILSKMDRKLQTTDIDLRENSLKISQNTKDITQANEQINELKADIKEQDIKIKDTKDKLEATIHEEAKKIQKSERAKIESAKAELEAKNKKIETKMQKLENQQQQDELKLKKEEDKIQRIENDVNTLKEKDTQFVRYKKSVEERVKKIKEIASAKSTDIKNIASTMQRMATEIDTIQLMYFNTDTVESVFPLLSGTEELKTYQEKIKGEIEEIQIGKRTKEIITEAKVQAKDDPNKVVINLPVLEIPCEIKALKLEERRTFNVFFYYSDRYFNEQLQNTFFSIRDLGGRKADLFSEYAQTAEQKRHSDICFGKYFTEQDVRFSVRVPTREEENKLGGINKRLLTLAIAFKPVTKEEAEAIQKEITSNKYLYTYSYDKTDRGIYVAPTPVLFTHIFYYDLKATDTAQQTTVSDAVKLLRSVTWSIPRVRAKVDAEYLIKNDKEYSQEEKVMKQAVNDNFRSFKYDYTFSEMSEYVMGKKTLIRTTVVFPSYCLIYPFIDDRYPVDLGKFTGYDDKWEGYAYSYKWLGTHKAIPFLEAWANNTLENREKAIQAVLQAGNVKADYFNDNILVCIDYNNNYYISRVLNSRFWGTELGRTKIPPRQEHEYSSDVANFARRKVPEFAFMCGRYGHQGYYWSNLLRFDNDRAIPCIRLPEGMGGADVSEKVFVDEALRQDRSRYDDFPLIERRPISKNMVMEIFIKGGDAGNANARPQTWVSAKCTARLFVVN